ncbi:MAG TPA: hypothetical protein VJP03_03175 [Actinomycetota bacterium]|nr:hypothetical protein [Actinomycetota bacterium]
MNEESLQRANAFLAAVAARATPGDLVDLSPAELGKEIGVVEPLAAARAVRALLARRRLEAVDGRYRLLDVTPIEAGEREQVPRPRRAARRQPRPSRQEQGGRPTYSEIGREVVERTIELGREVGTLRGSLRAAREEARESREAWEEADRRAQRLSVKVKELEARAEMAETNLRTLLAAARGTGRDATLGDTEMEAILGVLKGEPGEPGEPAEPAEQAEPGEPGEPGEADRPAEPVERETADASGAGETA